MIRLLPVVLLAGCTKDDFDRAQMLANTAESVFHPAHDAFHDDAAAVETAATTFCTSRNQADLDAARTAWTAVRADLKTVEAWSFGPYRFFGIDLMRNIDKWPGSATNIEALLASSTVIDASWAASADYTQRTTGYPAIEYLLWSDGAGTLARYPADASGDRRCLLLTTLATHAKGFVDAYWSAWDPDGDDYEGAFARAGQDSPVYATEQDAITDHVSGMLTATTGLSAQELGIPLGDMNGGVALPDEVESPYADASLDHIAWVLDGVEKSYVGEGSGLSDYVVSRQASGDVDGIVRERLQDAKDAVAAVPAPLETAVATDPTPVRAAADAIDALAATLSGELSTLLGINPTAVEGDND